MTFIFPSLVSKIGKNVSDHSELVKAQEVFKDWMKQARESVKECVGNGDLAWINDKLKTIDRLSSRMTEGKFSLY